MGLIRETIKREVDSSNIQKYVAGTGEVVEYNEISNTAAINYIDPYGAGTLYRGNVPVVINNHGVFGYSIKPGDKVSLTFSNGSIYSPMITGVIGSDYTAMNTANSGGCIINEKTQTATLPEDFTPMSNDWFDFDNTNQSKYVNQYSGMYYDCDAFGRVYELSREVVYHGNNDQGITSVVNGSTVMVKANGDIDMFVGNNVGLRISKADQKIYLYGLTVEKAGQE